MHVVVPGKADTAVNLDSVGRNAPISVRRRRLAQAPRPAVPRRLRYSPPTPRSKPPTWRPRHRSSCSRTCAGRPGSCRSAGRTARAPWRIRPSCRAPFAPRPSSRPRSSPCRDRGSPASGFQPSPIVPTMSAALALTPLELHLAQLAGRIHRLERRDRDSRPLALSSANSVTPLPLRARRDQQIVRDMARR